MQPNESKPADDLNSFSFTVRLWGYCFSILEDAGRVPRNDNDCKIILSIIKTATAITACIFSTPVTGSLDCCRFFSRAVIRNCRDQEEEIPDLESGVQSPQLKT